MWISAEACGHITFLATPGYLQDVVFALVSPVSHEAA
jgi:hypothetical protein